MEKNNKLKELIEKGSFDSSWKEDFQFKIENEQAEDFLFELALRIILRLDELGWKKSRLAEELGVSQQYVSKLLRAKENLGVNTIYKISKVLGIKLIQIPELKIKEKSQITIQLRSQILDYRKAEYIDNQINYSEQKQFNSKWQKEEMLKYQSRC